MWHSIAVEAGEIASFESVAAIATDFTCEICESKFSSFKGLRTHAGRLHKPTASPIPQLDGEHDVYEKCLTTHL